MIRDQGSMIWNAPTTYPNLGKRGGLARKVRAFEGSDGAGCLPGSLRQFVGRMERAAARGRRRQNEGTGCARMGQGVALTGQEGGKAEMLKTEMLKFDEFLNLGASK